MGVSTTTMDAGPTRFTVPWLRDRNWDLLYISLSVVLVPLPYLLYLAIRDWAALAPLATSFETNIDDVSRQIVNAVVAILVGGPHMFVTFIRTSFDRTFVNRFRGLVWGSIAIPAIVIALAFFNIAALVAIFFFWASIHVLHQIVYIVECYNVKRKSSLTSLSRAIDYAVVLTSLYPIAAYRMWAGTFTIGPFDVGGEVGRFLAGTIPGITGFPAVLWYLAAGAFGLSLVAFTAKSIVEIRGGYAHVPKIVFIYVTATASFIVPSLPNLDTAFQGMNVWHSFQYLALTIYINNLRYEVGEEKRFRVFNNLSKTGKERRFYGTLVGITIADGAIAFLIYLALKSTGMPGGSAFETAYYIAVLSFLWMHYYHDHILFTEPQAVAIGA